MISRRRPLPPVLPASPALPSWARPSRRAETIGDARFLAGATLAVLDPLARDDHALGRLWRQRLALRSTAALTRLDRGVDEATLRDAWCLTRPGDDPGPAGRLYGAFRALGEARTLRSDDWAARLPALFDLTTDTTARAATACAALGGGNAVRDAAKTAAEVARLAAGLRPLALWLADTALARAFGWPAPVPLLASALLPADWRLLRDDDTWTAACEAAYARAAVAAIDLHADLARRAIRLAEVAPNLRSKGAAAVVDRLLSEDASAATASRITSDRSARRLFERLVELGAVRELTGRPTFRLYGL